MNLLEEACKPCTQQVIETLIQENESLTQAIQSDDYIEISAELTSRHNKTSLPLTDDFIDVMSGKLAHPPIIISYINISSGNRISIDAYNRLDIKVGYAPVHKLIHRHDDNTIITHYQNILSIRINKLSHFDKSRYSELIDTLIDSNLFEYKSRKDSADTDKRVYNSMRQVILRRFKVTACEWCFMFNPSISAALSRHLDSIDARKIGGTYYLHDSPRSETKIKIYNTDYKNSDARNCQPYSFMSGDRLRFEVLYKSRFFSENRNTLGVNEFKLQKDIFHLLAKYNIHHLKKHLLDKFKGIQLSDILSAAGVDSKTGFTDMINDSRSTQVSTDSRMRKIESEVSKLKATQEDIQTKQSQFEESTNAMLEETRREVEELKNILTETLDSKVDKRKLRIVG